MHSVSLSLMEVRRAPTVIMCVCCPWVLILMVALLLSIKETLAQNTTHHLTSHPGGNQGSLSDVVNTDVDYYDDTKLVEGGEDVTAHCDVRNHGGCKVDAFERCFRSDRCGCLRGFVRTDSGDCVAAQFFLGDISIVDTFADQPLTTDSRIYEAFVGQITSVIFRALAAETRGLLQVRVTSLSRDNGRVRIGWEVAVMAASKWKAVTLSRAYNEGLVDLAYVDTRDSLTKLNGTDFVLGANGTLPSFLQPIREFSHCVDKEHNYCDVNAHCVHSLGSFMCTCRDGFDDASIDVSRTPGERCVESCGCRNSGICKRNIKGSTFCKCPVWFLGSSCEVNGKEILIISGSVVAVLTIVVVLLCLTRRCYRAKRARQGRSGSRKSSTGYYSGSSNVGSSMQGRRSPLDITTTTGSGVVKLPRVWMMDNGSSSYATAQAHHRGDVPSRGYEAVTATTAAAAAAANSHHPRGEYRRWSHASDPVKYLDEYMMEEYVPHVGSLPPPRIQDSRKKRYCAGAYPLGNMNHAYGASTLPTRPAPRFFKP